MQILKSSYKYSLIEDLKKNTAELRLSIITSQDDNEKLLKLNSRISEHSLSTDSIIRIYRQEYSPLVLEGSFSKNIFPF